MAIIDDIKKNLANPNLNAKNKANLQAQLASAQGKKPTAAPNVPSKVPASPFVPQPQKALAPIKTTLNPLPAANKSVPIPNQGNKPAGPTSTPPQSPFVPQPTAPTAQPAAGAPAGTPTPGAPTQTTTTGTPTAPGATASTISGFDEAALLKAGMTQEQIDKAKMVLSPFQEAADSQTKRAGDYNEFVQKDLKDEQKNVEDLYADVKAKKEELTNESMKIVDESAAVQQDIASQEYQKNKFLNEQAQKQYELDSARAERLQEQSNDDNDAALRQSFSAQLGASFGSEGLTKLTKSKQDGEAILSDLRSQTAIGKSSFAFKAMEIESKYSTDIKKVNVDAKAEKLSLLRTLNDDLTAIDEKVLLSSEQKREEARNAVKDYYDKLDGIENTQAEKVSGLVEGLYTEKKELEKEKLEKESVDTNMSSALGFFANKYGQPIGVREGEPPKPWVGDYNEALSKQFGYLVDNKGNAVMGSDGKRITYTDFEKQKQQSLLDSWLNGSISPQDMEGLNGAVGTNEAIAGAFGEGAYGGQCGTFVRTRFTNETGGWPSTISDKKKWIQDKGFLKKDWAPQVGDVIVQDVGKWGHFTIINSISDDGKTFTLTESNWNLDERVHNTRKISVDDPTIYGAYRPQLKGPFADGQPAFTAPDAGQSEGGGIIDQKMQQLKDLRVSSPSTFEQLIKDATPQDILKMQQYGVFEGGGQMPEFDITQYQGDPQAWAQLPEETRKAFESTYTKEQINDIIVKGKSVDEAGVKEVDNTDTYMKLKDKLKPIITDLRDLDLQGSSFKNITPDTEQPYTDQSLVYTFNKLLDPGSVVKESEYATALKNSGWFQGFMGELSKADGKSLLSKDTRKKLLDEMNRLYDEKRKVYLAGLQDEKDFISGQNLDPYKAYPAFDNFLKPEGSTGNNFLDNLFKAVSGSKKTTESSTKSGYSFSEGPSGGSSSKTYNKYF